METNEKIWGIKNILLTVLFIILTLWVAGELLHLINALLSGMNYEIVKASSGLFIIGIFWVIAVFLWYQGVWKKWAKAS